MSLAELYAKPGHLIRRAHQISWALFLAECAEFNLTSVQYSALYAVRERPGVDATRLSALIAFDRSTIGNVLARLEARHLLTRRGSLEDRRLKLLYLTQEGERLLRDIEPMVERVQTRLLEALSERESAEFIRLLTKIAVSGNEITSAPLRFVPADPKSFVSTEG